MLLELNIKNLAIIESISIQWNRGLNILTGETGAGKSILLEALNLILGGRSDRSLVRTGQKEAWVEGLFEMESSIQEQLEEWGIEAPLDEPLVLRRVVQSNGRSRAYVNCATVPASHIRALAPRLVDFGRQHDQAILLNPENHLTLLDRFAKALPERERVEQAYAHVMSLLKEQKHLKDTRHYRADRMEFLLYQQEAIEEVNPMPGEEKALTEEIQQLSQREKQRELAQQAAGMLLTDENSVQDHLASAISPIERLIAYDESLESVVEDLQNALMSVEEAGRTLRSYQQKLNLDEQHVEELRDRLNEILKLQEKYGGDFESVMERLNDIERELDELAAQKEREAALSQLIEEAKEELTEAAVPLTEKRVAFASQLRQRVQSELEELAMAGTRFIVHFTPLNKRDGVACFWEDEPLAFPRPEPQHTTIAEDDVDDEDDEESSHANFYRIASWGAERGTFYLAANQGEEPRPLERVASGGELSRILLALKRVLAGATTVQTFVFDEIDSGVGGSAATKIAKKLRQIASETGEGAQILCISHTPQIAAEADAHLHVEKHTSEGRTRSRVVHLTHEQRIDEIARMLAGDQSLDQALVLARKLLNSASNAPLAAELDERPNVVTSFSP